VNLAALHTSDLASPFFVVVVLKPPPTVIIENLNNFKNFFRNQILFKVRKFDKIKNNIESYLQLSFILD
jgi:hypothetical protein